MNKPRFFSLMVCVALGMAAVAGLLLVVGDAARAQGSTRYVAPTGIDSGLCTNRLPPCRTVQYAVDRAADGDIIKVATGIYTGVQGRTIPPRYEDPPASGIITQVVYIDKMVIIRGGYTVPSFAEPPNPEGSPTTLDAEGNGRVVVISGEPSSALRADPWAGSPVAGVQVRAGQAIRPVLEGLRITGGDAGGLGGREGSDAGGGVYVINAAPTLSNNRVFSNTARHCAGLFLYGSDSTLSGNIINGNTAGDSGGGLCLYESDSTLTNNIVADNQAQVAGSALYVKGGSLGLVHNTIAHNSGADASGIYVTWSPRLRWYSTVTMTNTILVSHPVGIYVSSGNTATLEATLWGTGIWANESDWGGDGTVTTGTVNVWGDPAFVDPAAGDYHLGPGSAALDAGVDAGVTSDIDGQPRPYGSGYDIGADELHPHFYIYLPLVMRQYPECWSNTECETGDYCRKTVGDCVGPGTCEEKPTWCDPQWTPVCGCDGLTYQSECRAALAGISVAHWGICTGP